MTGRPIIIDTDPGVDDAIAILLALASPELNILGICAVAGNVPLAATRVNARRVCELARRTDIPVFAGCSRPMLRDQIYGKYSGESGLGGTLLPDPSMPEQDEHAVDFLSRTLLSAARGERDKVTVCTLGPLTNLGVALAMRPEIKGGIEAIVAMGGAFRVLGNRSPSAEYNILADAHSARIVLQSGAPITLAPLDMTFQALATQARVDHIRDLGTPVARAAAELITYYDRNDPERYGAIGGPLHDPTVIAWLLETGMFSGRDAWVGVDCEGPLTFGHTVVDWWGKTNTAANAYVLTDLDAVRFFGLLTDRLGRL